ncbi:hypothetical protein QBC35DRAFT_527580 [Podospora australis]|uniref:FR47-like domain-containing protein n=1 Tax=Podospora australis TaxID=1536484 RepID=A0AAN6X7I6_9PEZI|nr:hypothetical protein QBC35DRAFT_527580 [Podospora australis]
MTNQVPVKKKILIEDTTPQASFSLLEKLNAHLPFSLPVLRRLQFASKIAQTKQPHVLHACYEGNNSPEGEFAAAFVDLTRHPETQVWIYSTVEDRVVDPLDLDTMTVTGTGEEEDIELVLALLRRVRTIAAEEGHSAISEEGKDGREVLVGSLHELLRRELLTREVGLKKTGVVPEGLDWEYCHKWLFRVPEGLPEGYRGEKQTAEGDGQNNEKEQGGRGKGQGERLPQGKQGDMLKWDRLKKEDVRKVQSRTVIRREEATLMMLPSAVLREVDGTPVAWSFIGFDGTFLTLHVEEEYRRLGLAKAVACKLMRDHLPDFGDDGWGAADVIVTNTKSQGVCSSIGGKPGWIMSWALLDLSSLEDPL